MKIIKSIVRRFSRWAWSEEIMNSEGMASIEELHMKQGAMDLEIKQNPALASYVAKCFASILEGSPNYTEMKFNLYNPDKYEWITVLVKKGNGKTPHELRIEAEKERDNLINKHYSNCTPKEIEALYQLSKLPSCKLAELTKEYGTKQSN